MEGKIHSLETFGTVDGPGIRFVVFMQGCSLKCKFCHNRDTWDTNLGTLYTEDELIKEILKVKPYIDASGGGVTVSGGEPLLQAKFLIKLFKKLKNYNIHTAIDTSGNMPINNDIKEILTLTDLVLLDIKHINDEKCKDLCGVSNKYNLEFIRYLNDINKPTWIRQVLVPGYTDDENDLKDLKKFISSLKNVEKFEFLPYHTYGVHKWEELGLKYPLKGIREATNKDVLKAEKIMAL